MKKYLMVTVLDEWPKLSSPSYKFEFLRNIKHEQISDKNETVFVYL
jgi:hypothetical protein